MKRVAFVFGTSIDKIKPSDRFDVELQASPPSDFRVNEFDRLLDDIQEMRSAAGLGGAEEIVTVEQYCELADQYSKSDPSGWRAMVAGWDKEQGMTRAPGWRRAIWRLIGV